MWSWSSVSVWFLVSCHIALGDSRASVFFGCVRCMFVYVARVSGLREC